MRGCVAYDTYRGSLPFQAGLRNENQSIGGVGSFVDAAATVTPWLFRYYGGGIRRAGEILEKKKEERLRKVFREVLGTMNDER